MKHTRSRRQQTQKQRQGQRRRKTMRGGNTPVKVMPEKNMPATTPAPSTNHKNSKPDTTPKHSPGSS